MGSIHSKPVAEAEADGMDEAFIFSAEDGVGYLSFGIKSRIIIKVKNIFLTLIPETESQIVLV